MVIFPLKSIFKNYVVMTHITNKDPIFSCTYNIRMSFQVLWKNTLMLSVGILGHAMLQENIRNVYRAWKRTHCQCTLY